MGRCNTASPPLTTERMEIQFNRRSFGYTLTAKSDGASIQCGADESVYTKDDNGKVIKVDRDVCTNTMDDMVRAMDDMFYYREKPYEASELVKHIFDKLPKESIKPLLDSLNEDYGDDESED